MSLLPLKRTSIPFHVIPPLIVFSFSEAPAVVAAEPAATEAATTEAPKEEKKEEAKEEKKEEKVCSLELHLSQF